MNVIVGSAGNSAQQNMLAGGASAVVDVSLSSFNSSTHFNLSKKGSASGTVAGVIADDNVGSPSVHTTGGSKPITLLTTLPLTP
jgi:hypothetical protein